MEESTIKSDPLNITFNNKRLKGESMCACSLAFYDHLSISTHSINDDLAAQEFDCTTIHKSDTSVEILGTIKEGISNAFALKCTYYLTI